MILSKEQLIQLLDDIRFSINEDDSFEGYLNYSAVSFQQFEVEASVRIGNSMGQGGCILIERTEQK